MRSPNTAPEAPTVGVTFNAWIDVMLYPDSIMGLVFPPITMKAKWFVLIYAAIELVTGVTGTADGIAHFAHLGGLIFAFMLLWYWRKRGTLYSRYN